MGERTTREESGSRYRSALEAAGLRDVRPLYRALLKRIREEDADAYREAVRRYEEEVEPEVEESDDPLGVWLRYGAWLAGALVPGRIVAVDGSGRARDLDPGGGGSVEGVTGDVDGGPLLLHLPEPSRERALPLALPADPTGPQEATRELLCG